MKKVLSVLLILSISALFTACGSKNIGTSSSLVKKIIQDESGEEYFSQVSSSFLASDNDTTELTSSELEFDSDSDSEYDYDGTSMLTSFVISSKPSDTSKQTSSYKKEKTFGKNTVEFEGIAITIPDGFEEDSTMKDTYLSTETSKAGDNIVFSNLGNAKDDFSEEGINAMYEELFEDFSGCKYFSRYQIDGYDAVQYAYDVAVGGVPFTQIQVSCMLDKKIICITFSDFSGKSEADFEDSIKTLQIIE